MERLVKSLAPTASVVWARAFPDGTHAEAHRYSAAVSWITISEAAWDRSSAAERMDTIAHEVAHVLAWNEHGTDIEPHGREWRRIFRSLTARLA